MKKGDIGHGPAVALVVANMIGTGVFTSLGYQLEALPSAFPILVLWAVGGVLSFCGALCYAELVSMWPRSGGEYHLLREAYHPLAGFLAGWVSLVAGFAAPIALAAMAFGRYLAKLGVPVEPIWLAGGAVVLVTLIMLGSTSAVGRFLGGLTILKVTLIVAFMVGAMMPAGGGEVVASVSLMPKAGDWDLILSGGFATSLVYVMYAYTGWNGAAYVAGELRDPQRTVPLALLGGTALVMVLYVGLNAAFLVRAPWEMLRSEPEVALAAAKAIFGERGGAWMGGLIAFGLLSMLTGLTWAGSRVHQRLGQDLMRLGFLAKVNRHGAPVGAVLLQGGLALLLLFSGTFDAVLNYVEALLLVSSLLAVVAVIWLRWRRPEVARPFKVPLYPVPPLLFAAATSYMLIYLVQRRPQELMWGAVTLLAGWLIYVMVRAGEPDGASDEGGGK
ncbi:MAG: amino acid permease [Verrucomicrobiaceae bacterium]|nr:amino acid permease [Verrucomicrobiaceae bacterium]